MHLLAIDLGKRSFHVYGVEDDGVVISSALAAPSFRAWSRNSTLR